MFNCMHALELTIFLISLNSKFVESFDLGGVRMENKITSKYDVVLFNGRNDFHSWQKKMKALLSRNKCLIALEKDDSKWTQEQEGKCAEIEEDAYNLLILSLSDEVLRKIDGAETPFEVWAKLEAICKVQSAPNLVYLKELLFVVKMETNKTLEENMEFQKIVQLLKGIEERVSDSDLAMILLNSLTLDYMVVKDGLMYTGTFPKLESVTVALKAREGELRTKKKQAAPTGLIAKGSHDHSTSINQPDHYKKGKKKGKQSKGTKFESRKCFHSQKVGHW